MARAQANGIELEYETFGREDDPLLLLVMGLGAQLVAWDERFCRMLADRGFRVVRFDNRDIGLSTKIDDAPAPDVMAAFGGDASSAAYTLEDMADDAVGLLDALGAPAAHVVGVSMGGMIAQLVAIHHPERTLSLCSIMSTTGDRSVGQATEAATAALLTPAPSEREPFLDRAVEMAKVIGSPGFPFDEAAVRRRAAASFDRSYHPEGVARQLLAILASPDRTAALRSLRVPTVVIHGDADPLVTPDGGEATAAAVPDARHVVVPGMGHDLPADAWPRIVDAIVDNASRARAA